MTNPNNFYAKLYTKAAAAGYIEEETNATNAFQVDCWLADTATFDLLPLVEPYTTHKTAVQALIDFDGDVEAAAAWLNED